MIRIHCDVEGCGESTEAMLHHASIHGPCAFSVSPIERNHRWSKLEKAEPFGPNATIRADGWVCPKHLGELPKLKSPT